MSYGRYGEYHADSWNRGNYGKYSADSLKSGSGANTYDSYYYSNSSNYGTGVGNNAYYGENQYGNKGYQYDYPSKQNYSENPNNMYGSNYNNNYGSNAYDGTYQYGNNSSIPNAKNNTFTQNNRKPNSVKSPNPILPTPPISNAVISAPMHNSSKSPPNKINKINKKLAQIPCEHCKICFNSESQLLAHFKGKKHLDTLQGLQQGGGSTVVPEKIVKRPEFPCEICSLIFNSEKQATAHFNSRKHADQVKFLAQGGMNQNNAFPMGVSNVGRGMQNGTNYGSGPSYGGAPNYGSGTNYASGTNYGSGPNYNNAPNYNSGFNKTPYNYQTSAWNSADNNQRKFGAKVGRGGGSGNWNNASPFSADPVKKAVYDNMVGALPKKRKRDVKQIPCNTCGVNFNSQAQYQSHIEGSKHKRKVEGKPDIEPTKVKPENNIQPEAVTCKICDVSFNSESQYQAHVNGQKHQRKVEGKENEPTTEAVIKKKSPEEDSDGNDAENKKTKREVKQIPCKTCNDNFNSEAQYEAHIAGQKHKKKLAGATGNITMNNPIQTPQRYRCETCNVSVNSSQQMDAHFAGEKHKARLVSKEEAGNMEGQISGMYFCRNCNLSVPTASKLAEHIKTPEHVAKTDEIQGKKSLDKPMDVDSY